MAEVQRKRFNVVRRCSIDRHLSPFILQELERYVHDCEIKRLKLTAAQRVSLPESRHEVETKTSPIGPNKRVVGVLDPETNMLVKQYTAIGSAALVAMQMSKLGYDSGMEDISVPEVKSRIRSSAKDPSLLIFGYRWLFVQELRDRNFVVNVSINPKRVDGSSSESNEGITDESIAAISKRCVTSGIMLDTFRSTTAAYKDWCKALTISIDCEQDQTWQTFKKYYLNSNKSIDNVVWEVHKVESDIGGQQQGRNAVNYEKEYSFKIPLKKNSNTLQHRQASRTCKIKIESPASQLSADESEQCSGKDPSFSSKPLSLSTILTPMASCTKNNYQTLNNSNTMTKPLGAIAHLPDPNDDRTRISSCSNPEAVARLEAMMHSPSAIATDSGAGNMNGLLVSPGSKKRSRNFNHENLRQRKPRKNNDDVVNTP